jgi:hypothetical protein
MEFNFQPAAMLEFLVSHKNGRIKVVHRFKIYYHHHHL